ncbi:MAG: hypothetical protein RIQ94_3063 [Pseudomonadota bacterium]
MKILIFEYINGGGCAKTELPPSLAREGWFMLTAVLNDLMASGEHELSVLLDWRRVNTVPQGIRMITVKPHDDVLAIFTEALQECDAVLPIAPETEQILWTLCTRVDGRCVLALKNRVSVYCLQRQTLWLKLPINWKLLIFYRHIIFRLCRVSV